MSSSRTKKIVAALAAVLSTFLLTGCIKLDMDLTVNSDKTVSGTVIGGVSDYLDSLIKEYGDSSSSNDLTSELDSLFDKDTPGVTVQDYKSGGFTGKKYILDHVTLKEINGDGTDADSFNIKIAGDKATVSGVIDLSMDDSTTTGLDALGAGLTKSLFSSAQMRIAVRFPGKVVSSSGEISADGKQVIWTPVIGERNELTATVELPNAKKIIIYAGGAVGVLLLIALAFLLGRRGKKVTYSSTGDGSQGIITSGSDLHNDVRDSHHGDSGGSHHGDSSGDTDGGGSFDSGGSDGGTSSD